MRLEDYTPDAICRAMNLSGFIEPSWMQSEIPTLRVVLKPSFHPELCITVRGTTQGGVLSVVALAEQFWGQRGEVYLTSDREEIDSAAEVFEELVELFRKAHTAFDPKRQYACCDGMGTDSCLVSRAEIQLLKAHVSEQKASERFIGCLIELAWSGCELPRVRNALADAASYLNVKYPRQDVPARPVTRLAILGTPEEREQYLEMFKGQAKDTDRRAVEPGSPEAQLVCPECGSSRVVSNWTPPSYSLHCADCGWGVATSRFPPIFDDKTIYRVFLLPDGTKALSGIQTIKRFQGGTTQNAKNLLAEPMVFLFEGTAVGVFSKIESLRSEGINLLIQPPFPYARADLMGMRLR